MKRTALFAVTATTCLAAGLALAADTIKFGVAGPHSGDLASYGIPTRNAAELIVKEVNAKGGIHGKQIELLIEDDVCKPEIATNTHCSTPAKCPFYDVCHLGQHEHDLVFLPGIRRDAVVRFRESGVASITDVPVDEFARALAPMIAGDYEEERRTMLTGVVWRDEERIFEGFAVNDVVVSRGAASSMVELKVEIGSEFVANFRADGLILAAPTGSTAYALSAGGPILHPTIAGWLLVPIAPHTLSNRPIVLSSDSEIAIEIASDRDASANFDMQSLASLLHGDRVIVRRSEHSVRFLHPRGWSYFDTLRQKLGWNEGVAGL